MGAPVLAGGDGALRLWGALADVFPETKGQRWWVHKATVVLIALPKSAQPAAKKMLAEIRDAADRDHATTAAKAFTGGVRHQVTGGRRQDQRRPVRAARVLRLPRRALGHVKITNPIESTFATVPLRTKATKGPGSRAVGLAVDFKLLEAAETRWRGVDGPHLVALVRAGAHLDKGVIVELQQPQEEDAA